MDVQKGACTPNGVDKERFRLSGRSTALCGEQVGVALGAWQTAELRLARCFGECRGLTPEQLEDLYQETALVLLKRSFHSQEHLRHALRWGIKHRALHLHRDERRRGEILAQRAPELTLAAERREANRAPELAALLEDDRLIVTEFLAELSDLERHVFWLMAEGMRYRAIAPLLAVSVNEARKAARSCETKRERFQLLYDTGRLCGFRSKTIMAMQAGEPVADELAQRACAHVQGCAHCRKQHKTNAGRLRRSFQGQAAALLPIPVLAGHLGWLARIELRMRALHQRLVPYGPPPPGGGIREGAVATLAGGGVAAKLAAGAATVAVLAGGTIGATHALQHPQRHPRGASKAGRTPRATAAPTPGAASAVDPVAHASADAVSERVRSARSQRGGGRTSRPAHEPGGFAYLGVPTRSASGPSEQTRASAASTDTATGTTSSSSASGGGGSEQRGGGPFSP